MQPTRPANNTSRLPLWLLLLAALSLTGCATTSVPPAPPLMTQCPAVPAPPIAKQSQPATPYSTQWQQKVQGWRQLLKATPTTP